MEPSFHLKMVEFFVKFSLSGAKRSVNRVRNSDIEGTIGSQRCRVQGVGFKG
jgi:hypothetical protein